MYKKIDKYGLITHVKFKFGTKHLIVPLSLKCFVNGAPSSTTQQNSSGSHCAVTVQ